MDGEVDLPPGTVELGRFIGRMREGFGVLDSLGLRGFRIGDAGISPVHARAEDLAHEKDHRERYDAVFARALSDLKTAAELCLPFARLGGRFVAQKGPEIDEEIDKARPIIGQLGGVIEKTVRTRIPGTDIARTLVVMVKAKPTPARFPRSYAQITRPKVKG